MAQASPQHDPIQAVGGVIYRRDSAGQLEFLLIKKRLGYWTLPKGRIKAGEVEKVVMARDVLARTLGTLVGGTATPGQDGQVSVSVNGVAIVAGAYGHGRLREWAFGGVTRDLLSYAPLCCLMSH